MELYSLTGAALSIILFWINLSFIGIGVADTNEVPSVAIIPFTNKGDAKDDFYAGISYKRCIQCRYVEGGWLGRY